MPDEKTINANGEQEKVKVHVPRSLDSIQLPEEDAAKPAEINLNPEEGDDNVVADAEQVAKDKAEKEAADKKIADDKAAADKIEADKKAAADAGKTDEEKKAEADAAAKAKEEEDKAKGLTPFHEHPDWKKMQEENAKLRETVAKTQGQVEALLASGKTSTEEKKAAIKTAEERLQEDLDNGWTPKSQLEIAQRNNKYMREELEAKEAAKKEEQKTESDTVNDIAKQYNEAITNTVTELKLTEDEEKKVYTRVTELKNQGIVNPNPQNIGAILKMAHKELKAEGVITITPEKTPEQIKAEADAKAAEDKKKADEEAKKKTNSKISRGGSGGDEGGGKPEKKPISQLRRSLDDIVMSHRDELDGR